MKAMSYGLVKGQIDQVDEIVRISWVQPRVLDKERVTLMKDRLEKWQQSTEMILRQIESSAEELIQT